MESNPSNEKLTLEELAKRARNEIPEAPDLRFSIRRAIEEQGSKPPADWAQILLRWASLAHVRTSFCMAVATLMYTSYWELSRPEAKPEPPMPTFIIDRLFPE